MIFYKGAVSTYSLSYLPRFSYPCSPPQGHMSFRFAFIWVSRLSARFLTSWIEVVYLRFPVLKETPSGQHPRSGMQSNQAASPDYTAKKIKLSRAQDWPKVFSTWLKMPCQDWKSFASYPVFMCEQHVFPSDNLSFLFA